MDADLSKNAEQGGGAARSDQSETTPHTVPTTVPINVNGEQRATRATTLAALIEEGGYGDARVATALNGAFVPARLRAQTPLSAGDRVEIVAPRQGG